MLTFCKQRTRPPDQCYSLLCKWPRQANQWICTRRVTTSTNLINDAKHSNIKITSHFPFHPVPVTTEGKVLTVVYALYGIPIFLWYTIKLGALFRVVVMRFLRNMADCCKATIDRMVDQKRSIKNEMSGLAITVTRPVLREEVCFNIPFT